MRLFITTQKVDQNDPGLGFFHLWIEELAKHYEDVTVVCLEEGEHHLPLNTKVLSLGKDERVSRIQYILNFYRFAWVERKNYDTVFVHMNQEYILLGGILWRLLGKKIVLWRNHPEGSILTRISVMLSDIVLCTSSYSYTAQFSKTVSNMPVGVDTRVFFNKEKERKAKSILSIGRISPVKNIIRIIQIIRFLIKRGWTGNAYIYGSAPIRDQLYEKEVYREATTSVQEGIIHFEPNVAYGKIVDIYNTYEVYVNLTPTGSLDKTIFEAMACGMMVIVSNQALVGKIPNECICGEGSIEDFTEKVQKYFSLSCEEKNKITAHLRSYVEKEQSLHELMSRLPNLFEKI